MFFRSYSQHHILIVSHLKLKITSGASWSPGDVQPPEGILQQKRRGNRWTATMMGFSMIFIYPGKPKFQPEINGEETTVPTMCIHGTDNGILHERETIVTISPGLDQHRDIQLETASGAPKEELSWFIATVMARNTNYKYSKNPFIECIIPFITSYN